MKRIIFTIAMAFVCCVSFGQQASQLIPTQGLNPKPYTPPNYLFVDSTTNRIWPVRSRDVRMEPVNIQWLNDSVIVIADRRYVKLNGNYSNPTFVASLPANKVTGLAPVAVTSDYNDLSNKPILSNFLLASAAAGIYQVKGNYLTSYTETDPVWSSVSGSYRTKVQNDALYQPVGLYLTIETDPTIPTYSKGLSDFSVIKSSTDPLYKAIGYVPSFAEITGKPTTLSGFGITDGVTSSALSSSLANYVPTSTYASGLATKQNTLTLTTNGSGAPSLTNNLLNIPITTITPYTPGPGISISNNVVTNTAPDQTVVITGSNGVTASGIYPNFNIQQTTPTYNNAPARTLGTSFRPSTTRPTRVSYTVSITTAISLLNLNSAGSVALQISSDNINFTTINSAGISRTLAVSISVGLNETTMFNIQGEVPAGFYCRLQGTVSGGATSTFTSGQEVTY